MMLGNINNSNCNGVSLVLTPEKNFKYYKETIQQFQNCNFVYRWMDWSEDEIQQLNIALNVEKDPGIVVVGVTDEQLSRTAISKLNDLTYNTNSKCIVLWLAEHDQSSSSPSPKMFMEKLNMALMDSVNHIGIALKNSYATIKDPVSPSDTNAQLVAKCSSHWAGTNYFLGSKAMLGSEPTRITLKRSDLKFKPRGQ